MSVETSPRHRVVIIGGGFGGIYAARALRGAPVEVTIVDKRNFHLFQPLLYQVATGGLSPANIAMPLRKIFRRDRHTRIYLGEVTGFETKGKRVILADGELRYDSLIVAAGARHHYFGHSEWEATAPGLKTIEDATEIRRRLLLAFERAEREKDPERIRALLTFVVVGGGPTGVELAGAIGEITRDTMKRDFRQIDPTTARIVLVEGGDRVLNSFASELSGRAARSLRRLGVSVRSGSLVEDVTDDSVTVRHGDETETIVTETVFWAAGVAGSPLGAALRKATGCKLDEVGRVIVDEHLTVNGYPEIFVIGDMARFDQDGSPLPGVAPVAIQGGKYAAKTIRARLRRQQMKPFVYRDRGSMATVGRAAAVVEIGALKFSGYIAWLAWLFVHLIMLVGFDNRLLVLFQWAWNYATFNRGARLITGRNRGTSS